MAKLNLLLSPHILYGGINTTAYHDNKLYGVVNYFDHRYVPIIASLRPRNKTKDSHTYTESKDNRPMIIYQGLYLIKMLAIMPYYMVPTI